MDIFAVPVALAAAMLVSFELAKQRYSVCSQ
jgi:hypothetical protein